ncbi:DUF6482 family protein [Vibrio marisflavi]|uniref:Lysyl-tRNA synthetase n=1 Tax=Vibrio marisflavi CECT 7928 TaxID=634439 RepID=A0ABN8E664_9VIBR|nr:DUF6482 family protein [Vibrio marisflavi]CAH0541145.1 hypothetical protein VMF7928_03406 [Vibrio marisflavi CECT 7928]
MNREQLNKWFQGAVTTNHQTPKVYVIGCSGLSQYLLAVEYKHQLEPIKIDDEPVHYESIDRVKEELMRLGVDRAYLRLHNAYDECGSSDGQRYCDVELSL